MPSLYGMGVGFRLAAQPLTASMTESVTLKRSHEAASKGQIAEEALQDSLNTLLPENRVQFPGDEGNFAVNWLGGVQFLQVVAQNSHEEQKLAQSKEPASAKKIGYISQGNPTRSKRALLSGQVNHTKVGSFQEPPETNLSVQDELRLPSSTRSEPRALVLHIKLSDKAFLYDPFATDPQQLKIEIFFNGQLANCTLLQAKYIQKVPKSSNQVFAGTRVHDHAERPWVIHTPDILSATDSYLEDSNETEVQHRWVEICKALMSEANERGADVDGERPPTGAYLRELANMQMPDDVKNMQKFGSLQLGIIDVVVTVGSGKKIAKGAEYLKAPTRLHDDRYEYEVTEMGDFETRWIDSSTKASAGIKAAEKAPKQVAELNPDTERTKVAQTTAQSGSLNLSLSTNEEGTRELLHLITSQPTLGPNPSTPSSSAKEFLDSCIYPSISKQVEDREPPQKKIRAEVADNINRYPSGPPILHADSSRQMLPSQQSYVSTGGHLFPVASSLAPRIPQAEFNINQYDSFEHANPYQPPYLGMISSLDFAPSLGLQSLPLHSSSRVYGNQPPSVPTSREVTASRAAGSVYSSPYLHNSTIASQGSVYDPHLLRIPQTDDGLSNSSSLPQSSSSGGYHSPWSLGSTSLPNANLQPTPYPPTVSLPVHMASSGRLSSSIGFPQTSEDIQTSFSRHSDQRSHQIPGSRIALTRVVIRLGGRVIRSYFFTKPRTLPRKEPPMTTLSAEQPFFFGGIQETPSSADVFGPPVALLRSNKTPINRSMTSGELTNMKVGPGIYKGPQDGMRRTLCDSPSVDDLVRYNWGNLTFTMPSRANAADASEMESLKSLDNTYSHGSVHENPSAIIISEQAPGEKHFAPDVIGKPAMSGKLGKTNQDRSTLPEKNVTPAQTVTGPPNLKDNYSLGEADGSGKGHSRSSSSLSELTRTPDLSFSLPDVSSPETARIDSHSGSLVHAGSAITASGISSLRSSIRFSNMKEPAAVPSTLSIKSQDYSSDRMKMIEPQRKKCNPKTSAVSDSFDENTGSPRGPNRIDTTENSPLNKNCVIQLAVTDGSSSALRQIKSEKKGIFEEESVIVGCRFFISGC